MLVKFQLIIWYNCHGWLGVKNQLSIYLSTNTPKILFHPWTFQFLCIQIGKRKNKTRHWVRLQLQDCKHCSEPRQEKIPVVETRIQPTIILSSPGLSIKYHQLEQPVFKKSKSRTKTAYCCTQFNANCLLSCWDDSMLIFCLCRPIVTLHQGQGHWKQSLFVRLCFFFPLSQLNLFAHDVFACKTKSH